MPSALIHSNENLMSDNLGPLSSEIADFCSYITASIAENETNNLWLLDSENTEHEDLQYIKNYFSKNKEIDMTSSDISVLKENNIIDIGSMNSKPLAHYQLCIIFCSMELLEHPIVQKNIACIRNLHSNSIYIFSITDKHDIKGKKAMSINNQMLALGFNKTKSFEKENSHIQCFSYNIQRYNKKRVWNNAKNWANPNNFNRFRW